MKKKTSTMNSQISKTTTVNGINTEQIQEYIRMMGKESPVGVSSARLKHKWMNGFAVEGCVEMLGEAGKVLSRSHHSFKTDWPEPFSGDSGPTPGLELILSCAGACAATSFVLKASLEGIEIEELDVVTEGKVDLKGLFEVDDNTPARLLDVTVTIHVRSNSDDASIQKIADKLHNTSPVLDTLINPVSIELSANSL